MIVQIVSIANIIAVIMIIIVVVLGIMIPMKVITAMKGEALKQPRCPMEVGANALSYHV